MSECVVCNTKTENMAYNEAFEQHEPLCQDYLCEKRFYRETRGVIMSEGKEYE